MEKTEEPLTTKDTKERKGRSGDRRDRRDRVILEKTKSTPRRRGGAEKPKRLTTKDTKEHKGRSGDLVIAVIG